MGISHEDARAIAGGGVSVEQRRVDGLEPCCSGGLVVPRSPDEAICRALQLCESAFTSLLGACERSWRVANLFSTEARPAPARHRGCNLERWGGTSPYMRV